MCCKGGHVRSKTTWQLGGKIEKMELRLGMRKTKVARGQLAVSPKRRQI
jgi:hypothetical protein